VLQKKKKKRRKRKGQPQQVQTSKRTSSASDIHGHVPKRPKLWQQAGQREKRVNLHFTLIKFLALKLCLEYPDSDSLWNADKVRITPTQSYYIRLVKWNNDIISFFFFYLFLIFLLFICAYDAWVISPPCPHPLPYHTPRPLPLSPTPSIPGRNYFALISNFVVERV
jgi:hypothetical protein